MRSFCVLTILALYGILGDAVAEQSIIKRLPIGVFQLKSWNFLLNSISKSISPADDSSNVKTAPRWDDFVKVRTVKLAVLMAKGPGFCCPKGCHCCGDAPNVFSVPRDQNCCSDGTCCRDDSSCSYSCGVNSYS